MPSLARYVLPAIVFLTGASVLIIEMLALRVLSPYYGNTLFSVSSVISVILLALSVGYYAGGILADRRPSLQWFFGTILLSGLVLLVLHVAGSRLLPTLGESLSIEVGPLVASALLFLLPAVLLGMLSPYAVKLQSLSGPAAGVGSVTGTIFFWSTLGSIVGSLLAGFVLVPTVGVDRTLTATGVLLCLLGLVPLLVLRGRSRRAAPALLIALGLTAGLPRFVAQPAGIEGLVDQSDGVYQRVTIYEGAYYGRPARFLLLDRSESGAMFLDSTDPTDLVYDYTKYYSLYRIFTPQVRRALVLGGGAYSIPKALLAELPDAQVDVAEIEPSLFDRAKRHFAVTDSPRLHNYVEDGRRFLQDAKAPYDLIFGDVYYSYFSVPTQFTTEEFFALARARLTPGGVFIANMLGDLSRREPSLILAEIKTFRRVFPNSYFYAVEAAEKTNLLQNITLVGYLSDRRVDVTAPPVTTNPDPLIRFLRNRVVDVDRRFELSPYPVLTDDYAPVEYLTARVLRRSLGRAPGIDGREMHALAEQQVRYGPRGLGAAGRARVRDFLAAEVSGVAQELLAQRWTDTDGDGQPHELANVVGRLYASESRRIVLAAPNDSASAVGVLVELARHMIDSPMAPRVGVDFVFLDGVRRDDASGRGAVLGGTYFATHLDELYPDRPPVATVLVDDACAPGFDVARHVVDLSAAPAGAYDPDAVCDWKQLGSLAERLLAYVHAAK